MRALATLLATSIVATLLALGSALPAQGAALRECKGDDSVTVMNVSCARAKRVIWGALEKAWDQGGYTVRYDGFRCVFPYEDYYSMNCAKRVDGKRLVIRYAGD